MQVYYVCSKCSDEIAYTYANPHIPCSCCDNYYDTLRIPDSWTEKRLRNSTFLAGLILGALLYGVLHAFFNEVLL